MININRTLKQMNGKNNAHLQLTAKCFCKMFMVLFCHLFNIICFSVV